MNIGQGGGIGDLGGATDFAQKMLGQLGLGGARTSQSVSAANSAAIQVSPTFVQTNGGSPNVAPYVGGVSADPSSSATSSAAGQDPLRTTYNPSSLYRSTPAGYPTYDPLNSLGGGVTGNSDLTLPLLLGAGLLFFAFNEGG